MHKLTITAQRLLSLVVIIGFAIWCGLFFFQQIDLSTADLGRHITNGQVILREGIGSLVLKTNYYSYTFATYPFINHHWGSGVIFYILWKAFGFDGLSILFIILGVVTFLVFFIQAIRESNIAIACAVAAILLPLFTSRYEIRPEMITYILTGIFWLILWYHYQDKISGKWLLILPILSLIWVNLHIGFFMGTLLIVIFLISKVVNSIKAGLQPISSSTVKAKLFSIVNNSQVRWLTFSLILCQIGSIFNPNGLAGALYPTTIFKKYGYLIVENQSVRFLEVLGHTEGMHFTLFKIAVIILGLSFVGVIIFARRQFSLPLFAIAIVTSIMAYWGIRNFPFFALFCLPILGYNIKQILTARIILSWQIRPIYIIGISLIIISACLSRDIAYMSMQSEIMGIGLRPEINAAADFFRNHKLPTPIFNNYDIGGYLIFNLYPTEKVFVDNRPEAYPVEFFKNIYIPVQENDDDWQSLDAKHNFQSIVFSHRDYTPWGQQFLVTRVADPAWACVYADDYNIIFVKRNEQNAELITKYQIPSSRFGITKP